MKLKKFFYWIGIPVLLVVALVGVFTSGKAEHGEEQALPVKLLVTSPLKQDTVLTREYVAQLSAISHIELRALERGYLQKIYVDEGQFVRKGQLMFQIMPQLYQAEKQKAEAELSYANIEYKNTKELADKQVVSANELALAKARLDKAKAELSLASTHLGFTEIRAPFDGIMDRYHARQGSLLAEGDLLSTLSDNSRIWAYFNVPESEYLDLMSRAGADSSITVSLRMANHQVFPFQGKVETVQADFNNETGNIAFRASFPNPKKLLRHGETGNILMGQPINDGLIIPQKATFEVLDKKYVYVIDAANRVHSREITLAAEMPDVYVVAQGLKEGDKILLEGITKVRDLDKIQYRYEAPKQVLSHLTLPTE